MNTTNYNKDRYWIVGCLLPDSDLRVESLREINQFLVGPPEEGLDYCKVFLEEGNLIIADLKSNKI